jgi:WD40 repeat protein
VYRVAFSPNRSGGAYLATGGADNKVKVWDASGQLLWAGLHGDEVNDVAFSPDGMRLATAGRDSMVRIWEIATGSPVEILTDFPPGSWVSAVAFSDDGTLLASSGRDGQVRIWDTATWQLKTLLGQPEHWVWRVAFSPHRHDLATVKYNGLVTVWNVDSGTGRSWKGHTGIATAVAYSPDGRLLATGGTDGKVIEWDVSAAGEDASPPTRLTLTEPGPVDAIAFSPDGRYLAVAFEAHQVRVYPLDPEELTSMAHTRVTRSLTPDECLDYLHESQCPAS